MKSLTFNYDETYEPGFPAVEIEINGYQESSVPFTLPALVDSGADGTMILVDALQEIKAAYEDSVQMYGITGGASTVDRYLISVRIGPHLIRAIHAIAGPTNSEAILGRDVLNELVVTLNGPAFVTEISVEPSE